MSKVSLQILAQLDRDALKQISEKDFQKAVVEYAERRKWTVHYNFWSAVKLASGKWSATTRGGWPDLVAARMNTDDNTATWLAMELKSEIGSASKMQRHWLALFMAGGHEAGVYRPRDAERIMEMLK